MSETSASGLITRLYSLLRTHEIYPEDNDTAVRTRQDFIAYLRQFCESESLSDASLDHYAEHFMVNNRLAKPDMASLSQFARLSLRFKKNFLKKMRLEKECVEVDLLAFLRAFIHDWTMVKERRMLSWVRLPSLKCVVKLTEDEAEDEARIYQAKLSNFMDILSKMLVSHLRTFQDIVEGKTIDVLVIRRLIQEFISAVHEFGPRSLGFIALGAGDPREAVHGVLRAILAVRFAHHLGLDKRLQEDLVFACLYGAVGVESMPKELMNKAGDLTEEERRQLGSIASRSFEALLHLGAFTPTIALLINVAAALESAQVSDHPFGRILQVVRAYESLISHRPFRLAFHPVHAMQLIWADRDKKMDGAIVKAFIEFLGAYPPGSTWLDKDGNPIVILDAAQSALLRDNLWHPVQALPHKPVPLHLFPANPIQALVRLQ